MASITGCKRKVSSQTADTLTKRPSNKSKRTPKEEGTQPDTSIVAKSVECTEISCSACHLSISPEIHSRVEMKSSPPANKSNTPWILQWSADWSATLHTPCWEDVYKTARARGRSKIGACEKKMILEGAKSVERFYSLEEMKKEASRTASLILSANHCICFTGAGISTSSGIGDYRGKDGKWTLEDRHTDDSPDAAGVCLEEGVAYEKLIPTYTHEAIALLVRKGLIKHVISQNGDGLHLLSGLSDDNLSELHGNVFLEKCEKCGRVYSRDQYTLDDRASQYYEEIEEFGRTDVKLPRHAKKCLTCGLNHRTGRRCGDRKCRGYLKDTIINFGDLLDEEIISRAEREAKKNDLCLSLGSSMQVYPACDLVGAGQIPVRLVVCNRQETQFDCVCYQREGDERLGVRVFGDCDVFMREVMKELIPSELESWEEKRSERILFYSSKRRLD